MKAYILLLALVLGLTACGGSQDRDALQFANHSTDSSETADNAASTGQASSYLTEGEFEELIKHGEDRASAEGKKILVTAREMIENGDIVVGSCWDFVNAAYNKAGAKSPERDVIFKSKKTGPYAKHTDIEPGDWLYYINYSYNNVEHSAIFVEWIDYDNKEALMISYAGGNKKVVARYKSYDLSSVYHIMRAKMK